jgi:hypothetical protein
MVELHAARAASRRCLAPLSRSIWIVDGGFRNRLVRYGTERTRIHTGLCPRVSAFPRSVHRRSMGQGEHILGEALSSLAAKGTVVSQGFPRLDLGANSVYGLVLIGDEKAGNHTTSAVFFDKGELYLVQTIAPKDSPSRFGAGIGRFMETVRFHLQGYGFDEKIGHNYPIGDDDPGDRDLGNNRPARQN